MNSKKKLPEALPHYLKNLIKKTGGPAGPIGRQFIGDFAPSYKASLEDPLEEKKYEVMPGLIYKYSGRALWLVTNLCAAYCKFCMRGRLIKTKNPSQNIDKIINFLKTHKEIKEVILSGGDPLFTSQKHLTKIINELVKLQKQNKIGTIRIHTRLPISNPLLIQEWHYNLIKKIKNPYIVIHINHPLELTPQSIKTIENFKKKSNAILLSQSVLLKSINNSEKTLIELFNNLIKHGIIPYYLHQTDKVEFSKKFKVPFKKAVKLWSNIRPKLSGLSANAKFVIDVPHGVGKIVVPDINSWNTNINYYYDFNHKKHLTLNS